MKHKPELLAPAGSLESFFAALESGADAVYAGLRDFSARARAKNVTLAQMEKMLGYAHAHGQRIYVTLNTLVKEQELPQLVDILAHLAAMRIDGVIIQDLAVARLIRRHFPTIPLHASTQMTIHNTPGVLMLEELGFTRAVLARELHLDEIRTIAAATTVEIETFIHGALCFGISGQCHFSSYLGGHSGNRGRCAQPCRRLYTHRGKSGHYFSPNDLSAIDLLPELAAAGVVSFKIEGRMKSAEYVATVVSAYRLALDAPEAGRRDAVAKAKDILRQSFGRTPTKGFLYSHEPADISNPWQKGSTGRYLGEISAVRGDRLSFVTRDAVSVGERLRGQPKSDMAGSAWSVRDIFIGKRKVMEAPAGSSVDIACPFRFAVGDTIFKVSSREAFTLSENACQRRLDSVRGVKIPCRLTCMSDGATLTITALIVGETHCFSFPLGQLEPSRTPDMKAVLEAQFGKCGDTPFLLESLDAPEFPPLLIPSASFKELRRTFYRQLEDIVCSNFSQRISSARKAALADISSSLSSTPPRGSEELAVLLDNPKEWRFPLKNGANQVIIPLTCAVMHQLQQVIPRMKGHEDQIAWQLPLILFDRDLKPYRECLKYLYESGFRRFEVTGIAHFHLLRPFPGLLITTGYRCFSLNTQALKAWRELGASTSTLYLEDDRDNLFTLLAVSGADLSRIIAYSPIHVMMTKIRMKEVHSNIPLHSDRGEEYTAAFRDSLQIVTASRRFSLTAYHGELRSRGCRSFLLDLSATNREKWPDIIAAFKAGRPLPDTSEFNYIQGLA